MRFITLVIALLICTNAQAQIIRAEPFYVAPEAGVTNLLLDDYPGAAVAYSLRKLDKDYTGSAIRVRRSSDNTEQDIGFVNNYLDTAAMKTFVGANNGFVVTWYNQADSAGVFGVRNATQGTAANQPRIINAGLIEYSNSKPTIFFDGSNDRLTATSKIIDGNIFAHFTVLSFRTTASAFEVAYSQYSSSNDDSYQLRRNSTNNNAQIIYLTTNTSGTAAINSQRLLNVVKLNPTLTYYNNNVSDGTLSNANNIVGTTTTIGARSDGALFFGGNQQEHIIWNLDVTSNRSAITTNINSFYSIY